MTKGGSAAAAAAAVAAEGREAVGGASVTGAEGAIWASLSSTVESEATWKGWEPSSWVAAVLQQQQQQEQDNKVAHPPGATLSDASE